jgi:hypothetical protein
MSLPGCGLVPGLLAQRCEDAAWRAVSLAPRCVAVRACRGLEIERWGADAEAVARREARWREMAAGVVVTLYGRDIIRLSLSLNEG